MNSILFLSALIAGLFSAFVYFLLVAISFSDSGMVSGGIVFSSLLKFFGFFLLFASVIFWIIGLVRRYRGSWFFFYPSGIFNSLYLLHLAQGFQEAIFYWGIFGLILEIVLLGLVVLHWIIGFYVYWRRELFNRDWDFRVF